MIRLSRIFESSISFVLLKGKGYMYFLKDFALEASENLDPVCQGRG